MPQALHLGHQGAGLAPGTALLSWEVGNHPKRAQPQLLGSEAISSPLSALLLKKKLSNWKIGIKIPKSIFKVFLELSSLHFSLSK